MEVDGISDTSFLGLAFSLWALVVAYGVRILHALRSDVRQMGSELHDYIVKTETRLAVLENEVRRAADERRKHLN